MKKTMKTAETAEKKTAETAEKKTAAITGLTVKGIPSSAVKVYGDPLEKGKENSHFEFTADNGVKYLIPVNFDSFDQIVRSMINDVKTADITATYKIRENGKTVTEMTVTYNGENGEKFPSLRQFYDRKNTGGIDTADITLDGIKILYVNRMSKFREFTTDDNGIKIGIKIG